MMRDWLPRLYLEENTICATDGEYEGWLLGLQWRGYVIEVSYARRERMVAAFDGADTSNEIPQDASIATSGRTNGDVSMPPVAAVEAGRDPMAVRHD